MGTFRDLVESKGKEEMNEGEVPHHQVMQKIRDGEWEAMHDVKPGRHLDIIVHHSSGKKTRKQIQVGTINEESEMNNFRDLVEAQLNELSKATLGSYIEKAHRSSINHAVSLGKKRADADDVDRFTNRHMSDKYEMRDQIKKSLGADNKSQEKDMHKVRKREYGIYLATKRLVKESISEATEKGADHYKEYGEDAHASHLMGKRSEGLADDAKTDHERYKHFSDAAGHYGDRDHAVATHLRSTGNHEAAANHYDQAYQWKHRQVQHMRSAVEAHAHHVRKSMNDLVY